MKKYIAPELNVTVFAVEDVITASINTADIYTAGENADVASTVDYTEIFK